MLLGGPNVCRLATLKLTCWRQYMERSNRDGETFPQLFCLFREGDNLACRWFQPQPTSSTKNYLVRHSLLLDLWKVIINYCYYCWLTSLFRSNFRLKKLENIVQSIPFIQLPQVFTTVLYWSKIQPGNPYCMALAWGWFVIVPGASLLILGQRESLYVILWWIPSVLTPRVTLCASL